MDFNRLRLGEKIAGASGIALFIIMFIGWFGISAEDAADLSQEDLTDAAEAFPDVSASADSLNVSAWEAFSLIDIVLLLAVIAAVGLAVMSAMAQRVDLPVAASAITAGLGILATLLVLYRIIDTPFGFGREIGVFLGLIAAAGIAYGGWTAMQEEGTSFSAEADRLQGDRTDAPPPPPPPPPSGPAGPAA